MQIIVIVVIYQLKIDIYTACFIPYHCMAIELQRYHTCETLKDVGDEEQKWQKKCNDMIF